MNPYCEVKVKKGLDGETLDREARAGLSEEKYEVHILAKDKGNIIPTHSYLNESGNITKLARIIFLNLNSKSCHSTLVMISY